jgi:hypothetical protein
MPSAVSGKFRSQCEVQLTAGEPALCPKTRNFCPKEVGFLFCTGNREAAGSPKFGKFHQTVRLHIHLLITELYVLILKDELSNK